MSYHCTKGHVFGTGSNKYVVGARIDVAIKVIYTEHLTVIIQEECVFCYFWGGVLGGIMYADRTGHLAPPFVFYTEHVTVVIQKESVFCFFLGCRYVFLIQTGLCNWHPLFLPMSDSKNFVSVYNKCVWMIKIHVVICEFAKIGWVRYIRQNWSNFEWLLLA